MVFRLGYWSSLGRAWLHRDLSLGREQEEPDLLPSAELRSLRKGNNSGQKLIPALPPPRSLAVHGGQWCSGPRRSHVSRIGIGSRGRACRNEGRAGPMAPGARPVPVAPSSGLADPLGVSPQGEQCVSQASGLSAALLGSAS